MDQLIFASLSHTHYWYEVGMLKVPYCILYCLLQMCCILYSPVEFSKRRLGLLGLQYSINIMVINITRYLFA